ncbi:SGNH/GDSL hydrolase family protein [Coraliomargarita algicola]|uniref:SGNH/GDSL hydrolase family protein n=1 Tax=Coraliomargarita algicola TaxID=3092156 RepID=A0ABZ0RKJ6_9BACT|nr:SGNH/GDSL hydrolase family protein [Coraliomargarita sp. J2-16]WPJ96731.1 SGNH/GDSL hydrolase family protein [Coraliomargarita sp. J2-16]
MMKVSYLMNVSRVLLALVGSGLTVAAATRSEPIFRPGDVWAICGDSITQQGVYSVFLESYLLACQPEPAVRAVQCGWGGMTAGRYAKLMEAGAQSFEPAIVTTCFGMNDGRYDYLNDEVAATYRQSLVEIVRRFKQSGVRRVVLGGPGVVDTFTFRNPKTAISAEEYNQTLGQLSELAAEVAMEEGADFADVHTIMLDVMARAKQALGESYPVAGPTDGVHAGPNGHLIMAYAFLKALGCEGAIGTLELDLQSGRGSSTAGHRILSASSEGLEIESTRYPFCFVRGLGDRPDSVTSILPFLPFNQDLNRYVLKVSGLSAPSARVTWGSESKLFSSDQLEHGINLAAEFLENPFSAAFRKLDAAVSEKQRFEVFYLKQFVGQNQNELMQSQPETAPGLERAGRALREVDDLLASSVRGQIMPVVHRIRVQPVP